MAYYLKIKSGKVQLYNTRSNGVLDTFGRDIKDVDIQGDEIVAYKKNEKVELYRIHKGKVKGPYSVR